MNFKLTTIIKLFLFCSVICLGVWACSNNSPGDKEPSPNSTAEEAPISEEAVENVSDDIKDTPSAQTPSTTTDNLSSIAAEILQKEVITVGVKYDFPPFGTNGTGFDVDLAEAMAEMWGVEAKFTEVTTKDFIDKLTTGEVDLVIAATTYTRQRDEMIDFSQIYFMNQQGLLSYGDTRIDVLHRDLPGKTIGARTGSTSLQNIITLAADLNLKIEEIDTSQTITDVVNLLETGQIDVFTSDITYLQELASKNSNLTVAEPTLGPEPYAIGVREGESNLRELVDYTLQRLWLEGRYQEIYGQYFDGEPLYHIETFPGELSPPKNNPPCPSAYDKLNNNSTNEVLVIGVKEDFKPFGFKNDNEEFDGFDVDIAKEFVRRWFGDETQVEFRAVTSANRIQDLLDCKIDLIIASMTHRWNRADDIDFSQIYFFDRQGILANNPEIRNLKDLKGRRVACLQGSTSCGNIAEQVTGVTPVSLPNVEAMKSALLNNEVDAITSDSAFLIQIAIDNSNITSLRLLEEVSSEEPYAIGMRPDDNRLRKLVNFTLQDMKQDGTYDALYAKWFDPLKAWLTEKGVTVEVGQQPPYPIQIIPGDATNYLPQAKAKLLPSKIKLIRDRGNKLIVGVKCDLRPFGYCKNPAEVVDCDDVEGFDVDLVKAIADKWGVEPICVPVTSANRIAKLLSGEIDLIAASMTHTQARDVLIDFSHNYFKDGQGLLVRCTNERTNINDVFCTDAEIRGIDETLSGKTVAALAGSTSLENMMKWQNELDISEVIPFQTTDEAINALLNNEQNVDAFTTDSVALAQFTYEHPELGLVGKLRTEEHYGLGIPSGDTPFRDLVNFTLQDLKMGREYNKIYEDWFGLTAIPYRIEVLQSSPPITFTSAPDTIEVLETKIDIIKSINEGDNDASLVAAIQANFPPISNKLGTVFVGFDVDLIKEFARRWMSNENAIAIKDVPADERIQTLVDDEVNDKVDMLVAGLTRTNDRDKDIDFSITYFLDGQGFLVRDDDEINDLNDLDGKKVAVLTGTTSLDTIQNTQLPIFKDIQLQPVPFNSVAEALEALQSQNDEVRVDAYTSDSVVLAALAQDVGGLKVLDERISEEPYGVGVPHYDYQFRDLVNFTLQEIKRDCTYDRIYEDWFDDTTPYEIEIWPDATPLTEYKGINLTSPTGNTCSEIDTTTVPEETGSATVQNSVEYATVSGDSLSKIAQNKYGSPTLWQTIYDDNRDII
ncbi:MAG: transporter substrate-binding domain-containing protein, partial [Anaerolineae bacterium]|nr:transporter substrate-binding domain-containing protein [Anaerolineae bacterium]